MPPVACSRPISTVTPHTIRIVLHGIRLIASPSSAARAQRQQQPRPRGRQADVEAGNVEQLTRDRGDDQHGDHHERRNLVPVEAASAARPRPRRGLRA